MSGNKSYTAVVADADVYIAPLGSPVPATGAAFSAAWKLAGLLDGSAGSSNKAENQSKDFFAWGGILVASSRNQFKVSREITLYEVDNPVVMGLLWDTTGMVFNVDGSYAGDLAAPDLYHRFMAAFVNYNSDGTEKRLITKNYAQVASRGDQKDSEEDLTSVQITMDIYGDNGDKFFVSQKMLTQTLTP